MYQKNNINTKLFKKENKFKKYKDGHTYILAGGEQEGCSHSSFVGHQQRLRGFEVVSDKHRVHKDVEIILPVRADKGSAGYDFRTPIKIVLKPNERKLVFTDVKAYMLENEALELYIRSSIGVKKGIVFSNGTGIIDSTYYSNKDNDGNIGLGLWNTSDKTVVIEAQERVAQGIFKNYLITDDDKPLSEERTGGFGSSGTK